MSGRSARRDRGGAVGLDRGLGCLGCGSARGTVGDGVRGHEPLGRAHERSSEPLRAPVAAAADDEDVGHDLDLAVADRLRAVDERGRFLADGPGLLFVGLAGGDADRLDPASFGATQLGDALRLAFGRRRHGVGPVLGDLDLDPRVGEGVLRVGGSARGFEVRTGELRLLLLEVSLPVLARELSLLEHLHQVLREFDLLDVDTLDLDIVGLERTRDVRRRLRLDITTPGDEGRRGLRRQLVAEEVAHRRPHHLVNEARDGADGGDDLRGVGVGDVDLDLKGQLEVEAFGALGPDGLEVPVEPVLAGPVGPVEREDLGRHRLGLVETRVDAVLASPERIAPQAAAAGTYDLAMLELGAGDVLRLEPDERLHNLDLALVDLEHGLDLDAHEERVECIVSRHERIVLEAAAATSVEERLHVLVVVVNTVLAREDLGDNLRVGDFRGEHLLDVTPPAETTGDVGRVERRAVEDGHDADRVVVAAVLELVVIDGNEIELIGSDTEVLQERRAAPVLELLADRMPVDTVRGEYEERDGVHRYHFARLQHVALNALGTATVEEGLGVGERPELVVVRRGDAALRKRLADLRDDHSDAVRGNLHQRMLGDTETRPRAEPDARLKEIGLVASLTVERDGAVSSKLLEPEVLADETHLERADAVEALEEPEPEDEEADGDRPRLCEKRQQTLHAAVLCGLSGDA